MILLLYLVYSQIWLNFFFPGLSALQLPTSPNWKRKEKKRKERRMVRILGILLDRSHLQPNYLKPKMRMLLREKVFDD
jgi:hypothetical protein